MLNGIDAMSAIGTKAKLKVRGGKVKKARRQPELEEQAALIEWADKTVIDGIRIGDYLIHIPNEGKRGPKAAKDAKRLGLRAGVPDLFLALPRNGYAGLWIEMKSITGIATSEQIDWMRKLKNEGYSVFLSRSFGMAKDSVMKYMGK
ncbi:VRR-NUC domain [Serratia quinivorans]|uniref:VRR-NUC domain-containing protein n=1 Tax=Serratia quinivorans TaxID=137545 RepID=UPI002178079E|nr:VRR-NUC domain-containing protein [Serratia quinivorans]CAI1502735.1 VRR-NUC domain [Serratia quinivorans]